MSQNDMVIADADGATVLSDMNSAFQALASTSKGNTRPSTVYDGQLWIDDNSPSGTLWTLNLYNGSADVAIGLIDTVNDLFIPLLNPFCGATSGTNTLTASLSPAPAPAAYYPGVIYTFVAGATNTGAVTFNLDSLGARDVTKFGAVPLEPGDIQAGMICIVQDDGTQLQLINPYQWAVPSFSANKNGTDQTGILSATPTKITFTNELWDTHGWYDAANSRFTPLRAGKYRVTVQLVWSASNIVDAQLMQCLVYKNGSAFKASTDSTSGTGLQGITVSALVDMNGSTDYIEVYGYLAGAGNKTVNGGSSASYFEVEYVGA